MPASRELVCVAVVNVCAHLTIQSTNSPVGVVMFCSFATFGAFPILGYVVFPSAFPSASSNQLFGAACGVTGVVLFLLGSLKSRFGYVFVRCCPLYRIYSSLLTYFSILSTTNWFICGLETLLLGGACATIAFIIGQIVSSMGVVDEGGEV